MQLDNTKAEQLSAAFWLGFSDAYHDRATPLSDIVHFVRSAEQKHNVECAYQYGHEQGIKMSLIQKTKATELGFGEKT